MLKKLQHLLVTARKYPVFVIGTGRSGTHWLGYSLADHPEVRVTVETPPMFGLSTRIALDPTLEGKLFWRLAIAYKWQILKAVPKIYIDKTHPNIWIAEKLRRTFPHALFIGIERNPYATVASMMKHQGVSSWHRRWREFPVPNRFLGITPETADEYESFSFSAQCAMRWLSHHEEMKKLQRSLGSSLLVISYESFVHNTGKTMDDIKTFLGLREGIPIPEVNRESLYKWESQLTDKDLTHIENIVGFPPEVRKAIG